MNLVERFKALQVVLEQLGVELGRETLDLWLDRQQNGREPLPEAALRDLAAWAEKALADKT